MPDISKIQLPSGNIYNIKDAVARQAIAGGIKFIIALDEDTYRTYDSDELPSSILAGIPEGVTIYTENKSGEIVSIGTGTLPAEDAEPLAFYLVYGKISATAEPTTLDQYYEFIPVGDGQEEGHSEEKRWEMLGSTQIDLSSLGDLARYNRVNLARGNGALVLGKNTVFSAAPSTVTHTNVHKVTALLSDAEFDATEPTVSATVTKKKLTATASGTTIGANGTASVVKALGTVTTDTFVKSVSVTSGQKLVTTSITPVNGTEEVSKVTKTASKLVTTSVPNVTNRGSASTWGFALGSGDDAETLIISGGNGTAPTLGAAITVATGATDSNGSGSDIVTAVSVSDKTVAKAGTATTVATGAIDAAGSGASVVTGVETSVSGTAVTSIGSPTMETVLTGVKVNTNPTITLNVADSGAGVEVVSNVSNFTSTAPVVTVDRTNVDVAEEVGMAQVVANIGTSTAASQVITVGTNDEVKVAKYDDLNVTTS